MIKRVLLSIVLISLLAVPVLSCVPPVPLPPPPTTATPTVTPPVTPPAVPTFPAGFTISRSLDKTEVELGDKVRVMLEYKVTNTFPGLIIIEKLPLGWEIVGANREYKVFDPTTGEVRWLVYDKKGIKGGVIVYLAKVGGKAGKREISGEWKIVNIKGEISSDFIPPEKSAVQVK